MVEKTAPNPLLLSDEQYTAIYRKSFGLIDSRPTAPQLEFMRAIETAVREALAARGREVPTTLTDEQVAEFGALCVMNRHRKLTVRQLLAEYRENRGIAPQPSPAGLTEALASMVEAFSAEYPDPELGQEALLQWVTNRDQSMQAARAALSQQEGSAK